jgi:hypothetical protein
VKGCKRKRHCHRQRKEDSVDEKVALFVCRSYYLFHTTKYIAFFLKNTVFWHFFQKKVNLLQTPDLPQFLPRNKLCNTKRRGSGGCQKHLEESGSGPRSPAPENSRNVFPSPRSPSIGTAPVNCGAKSGNQGFTIDESEICILQGS